MKRERYLAVGAGCFWSAIVSFAMAGQQPTAHSAAASRGAGELPHGVVAVVNGVAITQLQFDSALRAMGQPDTPQAREALKEQLIDREIVRQAAEDEGLGSTPQVTHAIEVAKTNAENQLYLEKHLHPEAVTEEQVRARYEEIVRERGPQDYLVSAIFVRGELAAKATMAELESGLPFDIVARSHSIANNRYLGGMLPWINLKTPPEPGHTGGLPFPLAGAIATLKAGAYTEVALDADIYAIVRLEATRPAVKPAFGDLRGEIEQALTAAAHDAALHATLAQLARGADVQR
jgi:hypothetical protein